MIMKNDAGPSKKRNSGFTLIEVLVAAAITSILALTLTSMINQVISASDQYERLSRIRSNLTFGMNRMVQDLRRVGRSSETWEGDFQYRFLGIDGDDQFQNNTMTDERLDENDVADRMYFHLTLPDDDIGGSDPTRSGRGSVGYFISSQGNQAYQTGTWRLIRFNQKHDKENVINGKLINPLEPDIDSVTSYGEPGQKNDIAIQIDRLSFRYLDANGTWHNDWDSEDTSHPGVNYQGEFPLAVEIAVRGYDPNSDSPNSVRPQWRSTIVSLRPSN